MALASCRSSIKTILSYLACLPDPLLLLLLLLDLALLLLLLLLLALLLREEHVVDGDVHLGDPQTYEILDPVYDVPADGLRNLRDAPAVRNGRRDIYRGLDLPDLDGDPAGFAAAAAHTGDAAQQAADGLGGAAAHPNAVYLLRRNSRDLGDHAIFDARRAPIGMERAVLLGPLVTHSATPFVENNASPSAATCPERSLNRLARDKPINGQKKD